MLASLSDYYIPLAALDVDEEKYYPEEQAHTANHNVGNSQERILATQKRCGGKYHSLGALKLSHHIC